MSETSAQSVCPYCRATNTPPAKTCWLCGRNLPTETTAGAQAINPRQHDSLQFTIASILLATTLIAVFFAVFAMAPGLGISLAILSVPAFVRTGLVVQRRSQLGKPVPPARKALWFLGSIAVTTIVVTVVVVASVGTFCAVCLSAGTETAIPVALLAAGVTTMGVLVLCFRWIRGRWRRDTRED